MEKLAIIKLISGEEMVGIIRHKGKGTNEESVSVNFPLVIMYSPDGKIAVRPWLFCKEAQDENGEIMISPVAIAAIATPTDEMSEAYNDFKRREFSNLVCPTKEQQSIITGNNTIQ